MRYQFYREHKYVSAALNQDITEENEREKRIEMGYQLYLTYRKFVSDNLAHLHEEETQILPELQKLYSDSELQQVETETYREMTPEEMIDMLKILFPHMNCYDKQAMLLDILALEPEKFKIVWQAMQHILDPHERIAIEHQLLAPSNKSLPPPE